MKQLLVLGLAALLLGCNGNPKAISTDAPSAIPPQAKSDQTSEFQLALKSLSDEICAKVESPDSSEHLYGLFRSMYLLVENDLVGNVPWPVISERGPESRYILGVNHIDLNWTESDVEIRLTAFPSDSHAVSFIKSQNDFDYSHATRAPAQGTLNLAFPYLSRVAIESIDQAEQRLLATPVDNYKMRSAESDVFESPLSGDMGMYLIKTRINESQFNEQLPDDQFSRVTVYFAFQPPGTTIDPESITSGGW